jgi:transposase
MVFFSLTSQERRSLEEFIARTVLSNEARRAQALLWLDAGESPQVVATRLRASRQTVYNWASRFKRRRGERDICTRLADGKRSGRPATIASRLDPILANILDRNPRQLGCEADEWTIALLSRYLSKTCGFAVNRGSISGALQRVGKTLHAPHPHIDEFELEGVTG